MEACDLYDTINCDTCGGFMGYGDGDLNGTDFYCSKGCVPAMTAEELAAAEKSRY